MRFVIVSGMSGAGKSTALNMLEDIGFFCVDNLPVELLVNFGEIASDRKVDVNQVAVGVDIRNGDRLFELDEQLALLSQLGIRYEILFLDANDRALVKRFKETRRNHPLAKDDRVEAGIARERTMISFIKEQADYIIDTSSLLTRELKKELDKIYIEENKYGNFIVTVLSFGFKFGIPDDADLVFDVRFLPNPYYDTELRNFTGNDEPIQRFVMDHEESRLFMEKLEDLLIFLIPKYAGEGKHHLIIGIGCTGGRHRSVTIANALYEKLKGLDYSIRIEHRDVERGTNR